MRQDLVVFHYMLQISLVDASETFSSADQSFENGGRELAKSRVVTSVNSLRLGGARIHRWTSSMVRPMASVRFQAVIWTNTDILSIRSLWTYSSEIWTKLKKGLSHIKTLQNSVWDVLGHCIQTAHNDVIKWKHFPPYWPFVRGIHRSPVNSQHKSQWREALRAFFRSAPEETVK